MEVLDLELGGLKLIKPRRCSDKRGFFQQSYHYEQYAQQGLDIKFVQDNWSRSTKGTLRGMHYQVTSPQAKLVSVVRGEVFDVAVDVRKNSPTFGKWKGVLLSDENGHQLLVPRGFAHGFYVLSEEADFVYKCDGFYDAGDEAGFRWDDPDVAIEWPSGFEKLISDKDDQLPAWKDAIKFNC